MWFYKNYEEHKCKALVFGPESKTVSRILNQVYISEYIINCLQLWFIDIFYISEIPLNAIGIIKALRRLLMKLIGGLK